MGAAAEDEVGRDRLGVAALVILFFYVATIVRLGGTS